MNKIKNIYKNKMHQTIPEEGFFNKGLRLANNGVQLMGTLKGLYEGGRFIYGGIQAARPLLSLL